mmetsp:Transcript_68450/g.164364  ORF Transcript_68450/g.164364 Transcript_68450/m.164364 type:complete len:518 (+) Transcript_68450:103-1656(+)
MELKNGRPSSSSSSSSRPSEPLSLAAATTNFVAQKLLGRPSAGSKSGRKRAAKGRLKPRHASGGQKKPLSLCCWRLAPEPEELTFKEELPEEDAIPKVGRCRFILEAEIVEPEPLGLVPQPSLRQASREMIPLRSALKQQPSVLLDELAPSSTDRQVSPEGVYQSKTSSCQSRQCAADQSLTLSQNQSHIITEVVKEDGSEHGDGDASKSLKVFAGLLRHGGCGGCFQGLLSHKRGRNRSDSEASSLLDERIDCGKVGIKAKDSLLLMLSTNSDRDDHSDDGMQRVASSRSQLASACRALPMPAAPTDKPPIHTEEVREPGFFDGVCRALQDMRVVKHYMEEAVHCYDMTFTPWQDLGSGLKVAKANYMQPIEQKIPGWLMRLAGVPEASRTMTIFQLGQSASANEVTMVQNTSMRDIMYGERFRVRATLVFGLQADGVTTSVRAYGEVLWIDPLPMALLPVMRFLDQTVRSELRRLAPSGAKFMKEVGMALSPRGSSDEKPRRPCIAELMPTTMLS